jgi:hypothetical protein
VQSTGATSSERRNVKLETQRKKTITKHGLNACTSLKKAHLARVAYAIRSVPDRLLVFNFFSKEYGGDKLASNKAMQRKFGVYFHT